MRLAGALILLLVSAGLALHGQPSLQQKWGFMAEQYGARLTGRQVYIDPAELLDLINNDLIDLLIYDVREESDWNWFHLVDAERLDPDALEAQRDRLMAMPENGVVVVVSNDELAATEAWKRLMALAKPNAYILEGGLNHWLNIYGIASEESDSHGATSLVRPDGTLRHPFKSALGDRHAAARPDERHVPQRDYTPKVKLLKKIAKVGGCG
jgi:rhodanese-related sulfurtransferase